MRFAEAKQAKLLQILNKAVAVRAGLGSFKFGAVCCKFCRVKDEQDGAKNTLFWL